MPLRFAFYVLTVAALCLEASLLPAQPPAGDVAAKAARGKEAMAAGRYDEAARLYAQVVAALPAEAGMRLNLGVATSMAGRPADAVPHFEQALKLQPGLLPAALFLGAAHMELGQPAKAVAPLQKVVAGEPKNAQARQMLADALLALGRHVESARHFRRLAQDAPDKPQGWYGLGRSYEGIAGEAFDRLQRSVPESHWVALLVAEVMAAQGRHANAFRLYRDALARRPGLAEAHEAVAGIYEKTGHADWAEAERARARAAKPDCRRPSLECDFRAGRHTAVLAAAGSLKTPEADFWRARSANELARQAFARLGRLPPSREGALFQAQVLQGQRRHVEAAGALRKAVEAWPQDTALRRELAAALYGARDYEAAQPILEALRQADPRDPQLAYLLGDTLLQRQQAAEAVPLLEAAVRTDPTVLPARVALAQAYVQKGEAAAALPHLEAATAIDRDGTLHHMLSRAYQAAGQADRAAEALKKSQEMRQAAEAEGRDLAEEFKITPP